MNKLKLWGLVSLTAMAMASCDSGTPFHQGDAEGRLSLSVDLDNQVVSNTTITHSRAADGGVEAEDITVNDLVMAITSIKEGGTMYLPLSTFDENMTFPVGAYRLEVFYGDKADEGFGNPYYYGKADNDIIIKENDVTPVSVKAELANSMFTIVYTDRLKSYFTSYLAELKSETGAEAIAYPADSTRRVYMHAGEQVKVSLKFTKPNGTSAEVLAASKVTEAKKHYKITLDVEGLPTTTEGAALTVTFDDNLTEVEPVTISLDDAELTAPAPTIETIGFTDGQTITYTEGAAYGEDLTFSIYAPGKLASVKIDTDNSVLIDGWNETIELMGATAEQQAALQALGLQAKGVWRNPDQMAIVSLKDVIKNIKLPTQAAQDVKFTLTATDRNAKSASKSVTMNIEKLKVQLAISNPQPATMALGQTEMTLDVKYNGPFIEDNVKVLYNDAYGNWSYATVTYDDTATPETYVAHLSELPTSGDFELKAVYQDTDESNQVDIKRSYPNINITIDEADVWTTKAEATILTTDGQSCIPQAFTACAYVKEGSGDYKLVNNADLTTVNVDFTGDKAILTYLKPNTTYSLKVTLSGDPADLQGDCTFTTEAAAQLPNNNMDTWHQVDGQSHWNVQYPGASTSSEWGTNNPMTTSQGGNFAYVRISGTIPTTDARSGKAALIRTVGWGSGNTATGSGGGSGSTKYVDAGLLHLGANRTTRPAGYGDREGALTTDDLNCGIAFASRPSSMSFWYKYSPKNSADKGYAEIQVIDASGNVISSAVKNLDAASSYTQITMPLSYGANAKKAAKIYVKFLSTNDRSFLVKNDDNLDGPGFGGKAGAGTYLGSQLYIDDITLNY